MTVLELVTVLVAVVTDLESAIGLVVGVIDLELVTDLAAVVIDLELVTDLAAVVTVLGAGVTVLESETVLVVVTVLESVTVLVVVTDLESVTVLGAGVTVLELETVLAIVLAIVRRVGLATDQGNGLLELVRRVGVHPALVRPVGDHQVSDLRALVIGPSLVRDIGHAIPTIGGAGVAVRTTGGHGPRLVR